MLKPDFHVGSGLQKSLLMLVLAVSATPLMAENSVAPGSGSHEQQVLNWRANRDAGLRREHGWLSLVGLEWLQQGTNTLGSGTGNSVHIPGGPARWGIIELNGDELIFSVEPNSAVLVDGQEVIQATLQADNGESPTTISFDTIAVQVIFRESYGLRIADSQAPARLNFQGIDHYSIQSDWLIDGRFLAAEPGKTIEIGNVLGQLLNMPVFGYFEFDADGRTHRLAGIGEEDSDSLWFIFADRTSGRETYGAGRFLYSEAMPENGRLLVDFNKAYNPPCAFNEYSTCPLPPLENRLDLKVTAGEKTYREAGK
jgi:uncharacterized protein (DUF1684 family)